MSARVWRIACSVDERTYERARAVSAQHERPLSWLLEQALEIVLEDAEHEWSTPSPRRAYKPLYGGGR